MGFQLIALKHVLIVFKVQKIIEVTWRSIFCLVTIKSKGAILQLCRFSYIRATFLTSALCRVTLSAFSSKPGLYLITSGNDNDRLNLFAFYLGLSPNVDQLISLEIF